MPIADGDVRAEFIFDDAHRLRGSFPAELSSPGYLQSNYPKSA